MATARTITLASAERVIKDRYIQAEICHGLQSGKTAGLRRPRIGPRGTTLALFSR